MNPLVHEIARRVGAVLDVSPEDVRALITTPPDEAMGDYALPCFAFAQQLKRSPADIAQELADQIVGSPIETVQAAGPYLNVTVDHGELMRHIVGQVLNEGERFGGGDDGAGQTIVIDYSSVNIARPFSVGHLRSTILGHTLKLIYRHLGYNVIGVNHLGDWGKQFGALIAAYKRWGSREQLEQDRVYELLRLYENSTTKPKNSPNSKTRPAPGSASWSRATPKRPSSGSGSSTRVFRSSTNTTTSSASSSRRFAARAPIATRRIRSSSGCWTKASPARVRAPSSFRWMRMTTRSNRP